MGKQEHVAIIGGGLSGAKSAEELRSCGFEGAITIFAAEDHVPYERPPFSKDYLQSKSEFSEALVHEQSWYDEHQVLLRLGTRVASLDPAAKTLCTVSGETIGWDKLILATGSAPRRLPLPGAEAHNVHYLRTIEDSTAIRSSFGKGKNLVIIGGGWIGLEVAAAARAADTGVTILEGASAPLLNVLGPQNAAVFAKLHTDHGVELRTGVKITQLVTDGTRATGVQLEDGQVINADAVVIGIGVAPEVELAAAAGLEVENGVLVDAALTTSSPDIYAVGDIANHDHPVLGRRVRVEHWATALNQPSAVAASITGSRTEYTELPYFFSDQYELGMEYIGHAPLGSYDKIIVRGDAETLEFMAFWVSAQNKVLAGMNVNIWDVVDDVKSLILSGRSIDPARLADASVPLADL